MVKASANKGVKNPVKTVTFSKRCQLCRSCTNQEYDRKPNYTSFPKVKGAESDSSPRTAVNTLANSRMVVPTSASSTASSSSAASSSAEVEASDELDLHGGGHQETI